MSFCVVIDHSFSSLFSIPLCESVTMVFIHSINGHLIGFQLGATRAVRSISVAVSWCTGACISLAYIPRSTRAES